MEDTNAAILAHLQAIDEKLERIDAEVTQLSRRQRALDDLLQEFGPLAREVYDTLLQELCCVDEEFHIDDLARLARKMLRNTRRFSDLLDALASAHDFAQDAAPLSREVFDSAVQTLEDIERAGGFAYAREFAHLVNHVLEEFTPEDVEQLAHAITDILKTTKSLTQPDVLHMVNRSLAVVREQEPRPMGLFGMLKTLHDPEVRQGLGLTFALLRQFPDALRTAGSPQIPQQDPPPQD